MPVAFWLCSRKGEWWTVSGVKGYCELKQQKGHQEIPGDLFFFTGAEERTRTADLLITNQLLYQLSYSG